MSQIALSGGPLSPKTQQLAERWLRRRGISLPADAWSGDPSQAVVHVPMGWAATAAVLPQATGEFEKIRGYVEATLPKGQLVVPTFHPEWINAGKQRYIGVFLHDIERALRVATEGWTPVKEDFLLDPGAIRATLWADAYEAALAADPEGVWLAYDIETPYKAAGGDESLAEFDDPTFTILRIGFSYGYGKTLSLPWSAEYFPVIRRLMASKGVKLVWNGAYDNPRLRANGVTIGGAIWDGMWGWHVLNSALDKGLAFVATFYCPDQPRWKHLSGTEGARYNAIDAIVTWRCLQGIVKDLHSHNQWIPFERHTVLLENPLLAMTTAGMPLDPLERKAFHDDLVVLEDRTQKGMEAVVPLAARSFQDLKKAPKVPKGEVEIPCLTPLPVCPGCGLVKPPKPHFRVLKKAVNPCGGLLPETREVASKKWRRYKPFTPSVVQMKAYQAALGHDPVHTKDRLRKVTFNEDAIKTLMRRYPGDPLYPLVLDERAITKLLGTYVGRWVEDVDGQECEGARAGSAGGLLEPHQGSSRMLELAGGPQLAGAGLCSLPGEGLGDQSLGVDLGAGADPLGTLGLASVRQSSLYQPGSLVPGDSEGQRPGHGSKGTTQVQGPTDGELPPGSSALCEGPVPAVLPAGVATQRGHWEGGLPVGKDGRVHTNYTSNPSTLRLSSVAPNLQNIPRAAGKDLSARVKAMFAADPDCWLLEVDYAAIEAVLVGYFASSPTYIRLAKLGVHDYLNSHILYRDGKIAGPADLGWSDSDLKAFFKDLKKRFETERDIAKKIVHLSNYGGTPPKIQGMHPELFAKVKDASNLQGLYFDVCPDVKVWQNRTVQLADKQGFLRNPYDYVHRFWKVQNWTSRDGEWFPSWGEDAKAALAFLPQSTAAGIIKEAILRLWYERDPEVGATLRLQVHDSLVAMIPKTKWEALAPTIWETMKEPIPQLPLPPEWGMGEFLVVNVEAKRGERWKGMEVVA